VAESRLQKALSIPVNALYWAGITKSSVGFHTTYRDAYVQTLSFLGDLINAISFTLLLEAQLMNIFPLSTTPDWQLSLCIHLLERYQELRFWLSSQYLGKDTKQTQLPLWSVPNENVLYLIRAFSTPYPIVQLKHHVNSCLKKNIRKEIKEYAEEGEENLIFYYRRKLLAKNLRNSDLSQLNNQKEIKGDVYYALFGIQITHPEKRPYEPLYEKGKSCHETYLQYQKIFKMNMSKKSSFESGFEENTQYKNEKALMQDLLDEDKYFPDKTFSQFY